ncbi:MAG: RagB/SusD family nutrient uptake outer membrane protein [Bacteroidales bacterium]|jgi:hypothetical protein
MKKTIIYLLAALMSVSSCDKFLDIVPDRIATIESAFTMEVKAKQFLFTCYSYLPDAASLSNNPAWFAGDELVAITETAVEYGLQGWNIARQNQSSGKVYNNYWDGLNGAKDLYQGISDCNIFLENIDKVPDMTTEEKSRWSSEVKFLKAYYHFWLVRMYGPIPIKDKNIPVSSPTEALRVYRNTLDECYEYIVTLLDEVIADPNLPDNIENVAEELGRITKPIAMSIKAEVMVTFASDLFCGNSEYIGVVDNRGIEIFSPNKSDAERKTRWQAAATACKEAIDLCHSLGITLYKYDQSPEFSIYHENYAKQMSHRCAVTKKWNSEIIWANTNSSTLALQTYSMVRGITAQHAGSMAVRGWLAAPLKIANKFYTKNGVPIDEDASWTGYNDNYGQVNATAEHTGLVHLGYQTAKINLDREIRYYANLAFDGTEWFGNGATINPTTKASNWWVQSKKGGPAQNGSSNSFNATNMWIKKLVNWESSLSTTSFTATYYPWPYMRLGNLYLLYAEALNEWDDLQGNEAIYWVDKIRERASLKGVVESWSNFSNNPSKPQTKDGRREIIRRERTIELAFEAQRFWDVRRWKIAHVEFNQDITGWSYQYKTGADYYQESLVFSQKFLMRDYWWPIFTEEILTNRNTLQNPGWE